MKQHVVQNMRLFLSTINYFFCNLIIAIFRKVFSILVIVISIFNSIDDQRLNEPLLFAINTTDINQRHER